MRVIVLKKNRSNKRGTPTATARDTTATTYVPPKKSLAKKELFVSKVDPGSPRGERKFSTATAPSMKTKWLKAIKSLKPASGSAAQADRRNGAAGSSSQPLRPNEDGSHHLQEYTYKKITACDVCSQILRGHTRQGLRCRICKLNAHGDCASQLPRCQPKQKLLRRQKSTSELENRIDIEEEIDYRLLNMAQMPSVANMTTAAYLSSGIGINYYATSATAMLPTGQTASLQMQQQQQPSTSAASAASTSSNSAAALATTICQQLPQQQQQQQYPYMTLQQQQQLLTQQQYHQQQQQILPADSGLRRRLFAGFRPMSGFGRIRSRSSQHRSISLPETPHSPRRQKLNLRMKSLSLDSPESSELHGQMRRRQPAAGPSTTGASSSYYHGGSGGHLEHSTPPSNNSRLHSPSSPSHQGRKLLYASRGMRGGSVDLPDEMEKSQSSASTSPCPSPVRYFQKSHRLLPTNLYVILYNFKARHADELDLKAGYKVTVIDTSDPDWWKGKVLGRVGYFPSKYCVRLNANEKPLQVTHNLQVSDGERGENMTLLRDQIVIQTGDEVNGMVMVRSADNRQGYCPVKYLQEV
ncbi:uncharacterized protein LOC111680041 isoform X2 [Lucilia cuprina]|uniref:uncharacterized protein LOC111680041 isoform X2 n=1 Tax=Lucilia cuprina TaxID=7375 RepID=UPI001F051BFE|nr:uncharacterized protein LOC111680041 isoform X2 [Lucilia cuprina]